MGIQSPSPLILALLGGAGLLIGSFLGTLVLRLPEGRSTVWGRSACEACGTTLSSWQLVPVMSWVAQRGRCSACRRKISLFYPAIEIAAMVTALWAGLFTSGIVLSLTLLLGWVLLALAAMDIRVFRLSDALTLPLIGAGMVAGWLLEPEHLLDHVIGALAGWGVLTLIGIVYLRIRKRPGLGQGDAKLLAAGGAWLGWQGLASILLIASFLALVVALGLHLFGRSMRPNTPLPFGAFLSLGIWLVWLYYPVMA
jgi:leader peptidase (prepilin peptidase)/N-methyltransferase